MFTRWLFLILISIVGVSNALGQQRCGQAHDYVVQAQEQSRWDSSRAELEEIRQKLKRASDLCPELGDAWYFRYLVEKQLNNPRYQEYALSKAKEFHSEKMALSINPFAEPETPVNVSPIVRQKWALVVGISRYQDNIPSLEYAAKDAGDFAAFLVDPSYGRFKPQNVRLLTNEQATLKNIKSGISWLTANADKDDLVVVYFSSHGSASENDAAGTNYIATYDTELRDLYASSLDMVQVVDRVRMAIKAQRAVIFLDTCYSGAATKGSNSSVAGDSSSPNVPSANAVGRGGKSLSSEASGVSYQILNRMQQNAGRAIITASAPNEQSWESDRLHNGAFTYYLIQSLKQSNGLLPIEQVYEYLQTRVTKQVFEEKNGQSQHPQMAVSSRKVNIVIGAPIQTP